LAIKSSERNDRPPKPLLVLANALGGIMPLNHLFNEAFGDGCLWLWRSREAAVALLVLFAAATGTRPVAPNFEEHRSLAQGDAAMFDRRPGPIAGAGAGAGKMVMEGANYKAMRLGSAVCSIAVGRKLRYRRKKVTSGCGPDTTG
jgi:hypothetical protein